MGKCRMKEYRTNEVIDKTGAPLICVGGFGQPACKYYKECRADMLLRTNKIKPKAPKGRRLISEFSGVTEADRTGKWNLNKEVFNEGLDGFPEVHI